MARPAAARTAFGPMVIAAVEQFEPPERRIVSDSLALRFLPPSLQLIVRACRWRPVHKRLFNVTEAKATGIWGGVLCRKRYADDRVAAALADGIDQVVVLGAGFDTRAYRLALNATVFEVDMAANVDAKRARLKRVPPHVRLVPVDFAKDDLGDSLRIAGFATDRPTMFVWEAVTQYLTEGDVRRTLTWLAKAASGSRLLVTYVRRDFLDGTDDYGAAGAYRDFVQRQHLWHFGLAPDEVAPLLDEYGFTVDEQVGALEYRRRYIEPTGRDLPVSEIERFAHATRR